LLDFSVSSPPRKALSRDANRDLASVHRIAHAALKEAGRRSGHPFWSYLEGRPGHLESRLRRV